MKKILPKQKRKINLRQKLSSFVDRISKILYPNNIKCLICGDDLPQKQDIEFCAKCEEKLEYIDNEKCCLRCGAKLIAEEKYCLNCQNNQFDFDMSRAVFVYDGAIKTIIYNLKYGNKPYISNTISYCMARKLKSLNWKVDMVVPVPSSKETLKERGFNQAELIARKLSEIIHVDFENEILQKIKHTEKQANLSGIERRTNLEGAFLVDNKYKAFLKGKTILLIDDVITSGSTISFCAKELKKNGAKAVLVLGFARAFYSIPTQSNLKNVKSFIN